MTFHKLLQQGLVDTHAHLSAGNYSNIAEVVEQASAAGIDAIIDVAVDLETSAKVVQTAQAFPFVYAAVGIDPEVLIPLSPMQMIFADEADFDSWLASSRTKLRELAQQPKVVMLGECGMDSYYLYRYLRDQKITRVEFDLSLDRQEKLFRLHCELAEEFNLPLSVHSRNCEARCLEILADYKCTAVLHSFTGSPKVARKALSAGHFLGVNAIVTYPSGANILVMHRELLGGKKYDPIKSHLVFETDAPFLFPFNAKAGTNTPKELARVYDYFMKQINS